MLKDLGWAAQSKETLWKAYTTVVHWLVRNGFLYLLWHNAYAQYCFLDKNCGYKEYSPRTWKENMATYMFQGLATKTADYTTIQNE